MENNNAKRETQSLLARLAGKFGVEPGKLLRCLTTQVFRQTDGREPTNEELMVLLLVCENYALNPFNREVYAFRGKGGDIVPIVSLDGWAKIVRQQPDFNGMSFSFSDTLVSVAGQQLPEFVTCSMRLKGIDAPVEIQEFMLECYQDRSSVWKKWPRRMLRTRAFIQCARLAFSLTGLYDEGEAFADGGFEGRLSQVASSRPMAAASSIVSAAPAKEPLPMDRNRLESLVGKLISHAQRRSGGWERAQQWVNGNLAGQDRSYALSQLEMSRNQMLEQSIQSVASELDEPVQDIPAEPVAEPEPGMPASSFD